MLREVAKDMEQSARTAEQCIKTAQMLFNLADCAIRVYTDEILSSEQEAEQDKKISEEHDIALCIIN